MAAWLLTHQPAWRLLFPNTSIDRGPPHHPTPPHLLPHPTCASVSTDSDHPTILHHPPPHLSPTHPPPLSPPRRDAACGGRQAAQAAQAQPDRDDVQVGGWVGGYPQPPFVCGGYICPRADAARKSVEHPFIHPSASCRHHLCCSLSRALHGWRCWGRLGSSMGSLGSANPSFLHHTTPHRTTPHWHLRPMQELVVQEAGRLPPAVSEQPPLGRRSLD